MGKNKRRNKMKKNELRQIKQTKAGASAVAPVIVKGFKGKSITVVDRFEYTKDELQALRAAKASKETADSAPATVTYKPKKSMAEQLGIKSKCISACSEAEVVKDITVPQELWSIWEGLMEALPKDEWIMTYQVDDEGNVTAWDFPKQKITKASVEIIGGDGSGHNGVVHSHNDMGSFHSHQDDIQCRNLYKYSIVLSMKAGEMQYVACSKATTPCGKYLYKDVKVYIQQPNVEDEVKEYLSRIEKPVYAPVKAAAYSYGVYDPVGAAYESDEAAYVRAWQQYAKGEIIGYEDYHGAVGHTDATLFDHNGNPIEKEEDKEDPFPSYSGIEACENCGILSLTNCTKCKSGFALASYLKGLLEEGGYSIKALYNALPNCGEHEVCDDPKNCESCYDVADAAELYQDTFPQSPEVKHIN